MKQRGLDLTSHCISFQGIAAPCFPINRLKGVFMGRWKPVETFLLCDPIISAFSLHD